MEYQLYKNIITHPDICNGKAVIKNTRITVQTIMEFVLAGENNEQILKSYPKLTEEDIVTCKEFLTLILEKPTFITPIKMVG
jgi:uncharacterized protein (DUF433 family)